MRAARSGSCASTTRPIVPISVTDDVKPQIYELGLSQTKRRHVSLNVATLKIFGEA